MSKILSGIVGAVAAALVWWVTIVPSPRATAIHFALGLPSGNLAPYTTPALAKNPAFTSALAQWRARDKAQGLEVAQGPIYADVVSQSRTAATADVISHYAEVYPDGRALNWEQDYTLTLTRGFIGGWKVASVDTRIQAVVQVLGSFKTYRQTNLVVPTGLYFPESTSPTKK